MKKISLLCAAAMTIAGMNSAANAVTIRPAGNSQTMSGNFVTKVGFVTTTCTLTVNYSVPELAPDGHGNPAAPPTAPAFQHSLATDNSHGNQIVVNSIALSGGTGCSLATLTSTPTITFNAAATTVTIAGLSATAIGGLVTCSGTINGTYDHALKRISFVNQSAGTCTFSGTLTSIDVDSGPHL